MSLAGTMDKASSLSCLCLSSDHTARPPVQIVLPYPPDPIMGGPTCRSRREARTLPATSNIEPIERLNRLTSIGQLEKQLTRTSGRIGAKPKDAKKD